MNYEQAMRHLEAHINLEAKAGRWEGLSLDRMQALVEVMGDPHRAYPVIHVTGTNGKGSSTAMITELLVARGLRVGSYTSPHLERINERIRLDGRPIDDPTFAAAIGAVGALEPLVEGRLSHFELLTAAAFGCFADEAVDVGVIEVGLLGRWDATNVVDAAVAVVTNVGRDHTDGSGDWRRAIAEEKAGIVKPGSTLVLGETAADLRAVFLDQGATEVFERGVHFGVSENRIAVGGRVVNLRGPYGSSHDEVFVALHGAHQGDNAALALAAVEAFFAGPIDDELVREAFAAVTVPGRFEVLHRQPLVIVDAAHNPDGARVAARTLADFDASRRRILVVGLLQGRDVAEMLTALEAHRAEVVIACQPAWPRRIPADDIARTAAAMGIGVEVVRDVDDAVHRALALAAEDDVVLVTGSQYVIGPARRLLTGLAGTN